MRKILIPEGRFGRYLFYAIGEIVLVVIGILIALQVNNLNQRRKDKIEEEIILANLYSEFSENKKIIDEKMEHIVSVDSICMQLMSFMNKDPEELAPYNLDSIVFLSMEHKSYNPSNAIISELLQVGKLKFITNPELKNEIFAWTRELAKYNTSYATYEKWIEEQVLTYYSKNIALKNLDKYSPIGWEKDSEFESGIYEIFKQREYENIIDNELYYIAVLEERYLVLMEIIESILELTN